jgi:hypothetical protein
MERSLHRFKLEGDLRKPKLMIEVHPLYPARLLLVVVGLAQVPGWPVPQDPPA